MDDRGKTNDASAELHRQALTWFHANAGAVVPFADLVSANDSPGTQMATKAKGIYKPTGSKYALSIRQTLNSPYADSPPPDNLEGTWKYSYHQEEPKNIADPASYWTNQSLAHNMHDSVPVGVLIQLSPKPNTQYRVLGLAYVTAWIDGVFRLEGVPSTSDFVPPDVFPGDSTTAIGPATSEGPNRRYWAFQANPTMYDIERAAHELVYDTWMTKRSPVRAGDRALIWKSLGRSSRRGIVAFAEILSDPSIDIPDESDLWVDGRKPTDEPRVAIQYVVPPDCPVWATPATEQILSRLSIWNGQGTVFHVTPEQWDQVVDLSGGWPDTVSAQLENEARQLETEGAFDPTSVIDARMRTTREIVQRQGQPAFRAKLIDAYSGHCAITGCDVLDVLEAAHIAPYKGTETNHVTNGLLLRSDVHTLFDIGLIAVDEDTMQIVVADHIKDSTYGQLHGKPLALPTLQAAHPNKTAIRQHRLSSRVESTPPSA